jgi:hypothetical protein
MSAKRVDVVGVVYFIPFSLALMDGSDSFFIPFFSTSQYGHGMGGRHTSLNSVFLCHIIFCLFISEAKRHWILGPGLGQKHLGVVGGSKDQLDTMILLWV